MMRGVGSVCAAFVLAAAASSAACSSTVVGTGGPAPSETRAPASPEPAGPPGPPGKRVFVTAEEYPADFPTLASADGACLNAARSAGLDGAWVAYLDDGKLGLARRIADVGPWYMRRVDGTGGVTWTEVFANAVNFHEPVDYAELDADENGRIILGGGAWTGVREDGSSDDTTTCAAWTKRDASENLVKGEVGFLGDGTKAWRAGFLAPCSASEHLYCFEQ